VRRGKGRKARFRKGKGREVKVWKGKGRNRGVERERKREGVSRGREKEEDAFGKGDGIRISNQNKIHFGDQTDTNFSTGPD
jgi:hypothetical protein